LRLPSWPVFAPVDEVYPARLGRVIARTGPVEAIAFNSGPRQGSPVVTVDNHPVGAHVDQTHRVRPEWSESATSEPVTVDVDTRACPGLLRYWGDSRLYRLEVDGTEVLMQIIGPRAPRTVRLERVTDLDPFRQRRFAMDEKSHTDFDAGRGNQEWRNPDALWHGPPDTTIELWAHRGLLREVAAQLDELPVELRPDFGAARALRVGRVDDGGFWFDAASHEQHRAVGGAFSDAERTVFLAMQLVRFLSAYAPWWASQSLRKRAIFDIARQVTGDADRGDTGHGADTAVGGGEGDDRWDAWAAHPRTQTGRPLSPVDAGSDALIEAWQRWSDDPVQPTA
jgi:hypothetical protein